MSSGRRTTGRTIYDRGCQPTHICNRRKTPTRSQEPVYPQTVDPLKQEQFHIIPLMGIVHAKREVPAELRDITGPGDALPVAITVDALGNMFTP